MGPDDALLLRALQPKSTRAISSSWLPPVAGSDAYPRPHPHLPPSSIQGGSSTGHPQAQPHPQSWAGPTTGTEASATTVSPRTPASRQPGYPPRAPYEPHLQPAAIETSTYGSHMRRPHSGSSHASSGQGGQQVLGGQQGHQGMGSSNADCGLMQDLQAHAGTHSLVARTGGEPNRCEAHRQRQRRENAVEVAQVPTGRPSQGRAAAPRGRSTSNSSRSSSGGSSRGRGQQSSFLSGACEGAAFGQLHDHQKPLVGRVRHVGERGDDTHVALSRLARSYCWQQYVDVRGKHSEVQLASVCSYMGVSGHALKSFLGLVLFLYNKVNSTMQPKCYIAKGICFLVPVHRIKCHQGACCT